MLRHLKKQLSVATILASMVAAEEELGDLRLLSF